MQISCWMDIRLTVCRRALGAATGLCAGAAPPPLPALVQPGAAPDPETRPLASVSQPIGGQAAVIIRQWSRVPVER